MKNTPLHILSEGNSILNQYIAEIRDEKVQADSLRFRRNLQRIGSLFAFEISRTLSYTEQEIATSLGIACVPVPQAYPVLAVILRAGLPFHQGFLDVFDRSESAFISAFRKTSKDGSFKINLESSSLVDVDGKTLIICDTMMATGSSIVLAYKHLLEKGNPSHVHFASILTSMEGLNYLRQNIRKSNVDIWVGAIDEELTAKAFLVPGLGDAGDLAFGKKM